MSNYDIYDIESGINYFKSAVKNLALNTFYNFRSRERSSLTGEEFIALKNLSKDKNIVITRPDKGNGVVILNKSDYVDKMHTILDDRSKFQKVSKELFEVILSLETKVNNFLSRVLKDGAINKVTYNSLHASGTKPGIMYGLPKCHKQNTPLRPILSTIGTASYQLGKYLISALAPYTTNEYVVKDTFSFVKEINSAKYPMATMASFDIVSLYTNIPLDETLDICMTLLFESEDTVLGFNRSQFKKALELSVKECFFLFNSQIYKQVDGVGMGCCLAPLIAILFLCFYERKWMDECPVEFKPIMYKRYVDDTFLLFKSPDHVPKFLSYLNSRHGNIKFTSEIEEDGNLAFLDVFVQKENTFPVSFSTLVFRKKDVYWLNHKIHLFHTGKLQTQSNSHPFQ